MSLEWSSRVMSSMFAFFEWGYAGRGFGSTCEHNFVHQVLSSIRKLFSLCGNMDGFMIILYWCALNGGWGVGSKRHWSPTAQAFLSAFWCRQSTNVTCTRASTSVEVEAAHHYDTCRNCQGFHFLKFPAIVFLHSCPSGIRFMYHLQGCAFCVSTGVVISAIS